ncbi:MAG TPA: hypothetical protein VH417_14285 [Vicinamibacterales bacterium]|jgi:hypothetical protein
MTRSTIPLSAAVLFLLVNLSAHAQQQPDFTGTWTMDMSRSESAAQGTDVSPRTPVTLIVRQSPADFNVETDRDGSKERLRFVFGQSSLAAPVGTAGRDATAIEPAGVEWRGGDLITTTVYRVNGMPVKQVRTHRLAPTGREMIVETRVEMQHGYESDHPEYKSGTVVTDVYTRTDHP